MHPHLRSMRDRGLVRLYDDRAEWLAARPGATRANIGASEAACCLGTGFRTPFEFWHARMVELAPDVDDRETAPDDGEDAVPTDPLARGTRWEPVVVAEYAAVTGRTTASVGAAFGRPGSIATVEHPVYPWATASPDAFAMDGDIGGVECKTSVTPAACWGPHGTVIPSAAEYDDAVLPPHYYTQALWQCEVLRLPWVDVAVLLGSYRMRVYRVLADPKTQGQLLAAVGAWRERHLVRGDPPPVDGTAAASTWLSRRYEAIKGLTVEADAGTAERLARFATAKARQKAAEAEAGLLRNELAAHMGQATTLHMPDDPRRGVRLSAGLSRRMTVYGFGQEG